VRIASAWTERRCVMGRPGLISPAEEREQRGIIRDEQENASRDNVDLGGYARGIQS